MKSARLLYRLLLALGALGAAAVATVLATIATNVSWSPGAVVVVCQVTVGPVLGALLVLMAVVVVRGGRAGVRGVRAERGARARPRVVGPLSGPGADRSRRRDVPVLVIDDPAPRAFCAGHLRPRVHVSTGALERLSPPQLRAVIAHERHHAVRRDPLRLLVARVLAEALFFLPAVRDLAGRYGALAEVAADEAAARETDAPTLASALLAFGDDRAEVVGVAPERVDHLLGARARWELPVALLALAAATLAFLAAVVAASAWWSGDELTATVVSPLAVPAALLLARRHVRRRDARR